MEEFIVTSIVSNVTSDTKEITSDCMSISFRNQGTTDAYIKPSTSGGSYIVLKPNQERNYSLIHPNMRYKSKYSVEFIGTGSSNLLVEKEYVKSVNCT